MMHHEFITSVTESSLSLPHAEVEEEEEEDVGDDDGKKAYFIIKANRTVSSVSHHPIHSICALIELIQSWR